MLCIFTSESPNLNNEQIPIIEFKVIQNLLFLSPTHKGFPPNDKTRWSFKNDGSWFPYKYSHCGPLVGSGVNSTKITNRFHLQIGSFDVTQGFPLSSMNRNTNVSSLVWLPHYPRTRFSSLRGLVSGEGNGPGKVLVLLETLLLRHWLEFPWVWVPKWKSLKTCEPFGSSRWPSKVRLVYLTSWSNANRLYISEEFKRS